MVTPQSARYLIGKSGSRPSSYLLATSTSMFIPSTFFCFPIQSSYLYTRWLPTLNSAPIGTITRTKSADLKCGSQPLICEHPLSISLTSTLSLFLYLLQLVYFICIQNDLRLPTFAVHAAQIGNASNSFSRPSRSRRFKSVSEDTVFWIRPSRSGLSCSKAGKWNVLVHT